MADLYPVNETFLSWQGEGVHLGRKAFFIRLQGCPVKCAWCDSASTWHPQFVPKQVRKETGGRAWVRQIILHEDTKNKASYQPKA